MAVSTSVWFDLLDALVAKCTANTTITTTYNTLVLDGPPLSDLYRQNTLIIGAQPSDTDPGTSAGDFTQRWGELGARARYEDVNVACELAVRDGNADLPTRRATAEAILAAIESDLRTDFTLGIPRLLWCHVTSAQFRQQRIQTASAVIVTFTVTGRARLASQ